MITGEYTELEYIVYSDGDEVYRAGNSPSDSQVYKPSGAGGVGLRQMRSWCIQTAREMAKERKATYGGCRRMEE